MVEPRWSKMIAMQILLMIFERIKIPARMTRNTFLTVNFSVNGGGSGKRDMILFDYNKIYTAASRWTAACYGNVGDIRVTRLSAAHLTMSYVRVQRWIRE